MFRIIRRAFYWLFHSPRDFAITVLDYLAPWLPDKFFIRLHFRLSMGYPLNLKNPKTFSEKLQWLKFNDIHEEYSQMVDKVEAKKYVASIIGKEHIIPTLGVWNSVDEIDWDALPNQFVLKPTNDSGGLVICRNKTTFDVEAAKAKLRALGNRDYSQISKEYPYKNVPHRFIAEEYMIDESGYELKDYKFFCFDGFAHSVMLCYDRFSGDTKFYFFDRDWQLLRLNKRGKNAPVGFSLPCPPNVKEMFQIADKLSEGKPFVRVDLYNVNGKIYFGEMTFFPDSGFDANILPETDELYGNLIKLNK